MSTSDICGCAIAGGCALYVIVKYAGTFFRWLARAVLGGGIMNWGRR